MTVWAKHNLSSYSVVILITTAIVFIIAGLAGWMGFSLAVGAMFAGLAYSRDPEEHRIDKGFELIYQFFARSSLSVSGWSLT
ncbi:cation:proton antiporter [Chloroflexi bacterium TSY]|nr:cation:proton antiporter [Chloroflexi bacterium TSY]